jgi:hypothetical protein
MQPLQLTKRECKGKMYVKNARKFHVGPEKKIIPDPEHWLLLYYFSRYRNVSRTGTDRHRVGVPVPNKHNASSYFIVKIHKQPACNLRPISTVNNVTWRENTTAGFAVGFH